MGKKEKKKKKVGVVGKKGQNWPFLGIHFTSLCGGSNRRTFASARPLHNTRHGN